MSTEQTPVEIIASLAASGWTVEDLKAVPSTRRLLEQSGLEGDLLRIEQQAQGR